jgi:hypothetical protein
MICAAGVEADHVDVAFATAWTVHVPDEVYETVPDEFHVQPAVLFVPRTMYVIDPLPFDVALVVGVNFNDDDAPTVVFGDQVTV